MVRAAGVLSSPWSELCPHGHRTKPEWGGVPTEPGAGGKTAPHPPHIRKTVTIKAAAAAAVDTVFRPTVQLG